jgi:hypothetical protein
MDLNLLVTLDALFGGGVERNCANDAGATRGACKATGSGGGLGSSGGGGSGGGGSGGGGGGAFGRAPMRHLDVCAADWMTAKQCPGPMGSGGHVSPLSSV